MMPRSMSLTGRPRGLLRRRAVLIVSVAVLTAFVVLNAALLRDQDSSNYPLIVGLGLLAGLGLGVGIAFAWDSYSGRLKRISDIEAATGLPVVGMIPPLRTEGADRIAVLASRRIEGLEAYGNLAAGLIGPLRETGASCLLITSPTTKAGRTTIATNLAASFAGDGMRVALISADPHSAGESVEQLFGRRSEPGLMEVLDGSSSLDAAVQASGVERLSVVAAGTSTGRGVVGYNLDDLAHVLDRLAKKVDLVVIDAPPVLGRLETVLLAQEVDLVLLTVDIRRGRRFEATIAVSYLGHVEDRLLGSVANDPGWRRRRPRRRRHRPAPVPAAATAAAQRSTPPRGQASRAMIISAMTRLGLRLRSSAGATVHAIGGGASSAARGATRSVRGRLAPVAASLQTPRQRRWVGAIATAVTVAIVISTVWWLSYDDGRSGERPSAEQSPHSPLAATVPSRQAAVEAAMDECRSSWEAQSEPLDAAGASLDQWHTHIAAMNQLVAGKITLDQASAFWEQTRDQATRKVNRFMRADTDYVGGQHSCRRPTVAPAAGAGLTAISACRRDIGQRDETLDAARVAIGRWHHHVVDMNMLRAGKLSPDRAVQLWLRNWKQGAAELDKYRSQLRQTDRGGC